MNVFCKAPWNSIHVRMDGSVFPCCISNYCIGTLQESTWEEIQNGDRMKELKEGFITFDSKILSYCKKCSLCTEGSSRLRYNNIPEGKLDIDIRVSNKCNLTCRMCSPWASSAWERETGQDGKTMNSTLRKQLIQTVKDKAPFVKNLTLVGGEPTLIREYYDILEYYVQQGYAQNVELIFNTNLQQFPKKFYDLCSNFKVVHMCMSIDALGEVGEVIRTGSSWKTVNKNVLKALDYRKRYPNFELCITPTVSVLNILYLDDLHQYGKERNIDVSGDNILFDPKELCIGYFSSRVKEKIKTSLLKSVYIPNQFVCKVIKYLDETDSLEKFDTKSYVYIKKIAPNYYRVAESTNKMLQSLV